MVWAGISVNGKKLTCMFLKNGTSTRVRYSHKILDQFVRQYAGDISPDFILMALLSVPTEHMSLMRI